MTKIKWHSCKVLPPCNTPVWTKIDDEFGERCVKKLVLQQTGTTYMWFTCDLLLYIYYRPTHWAPITEEEHAN